jgi:hypothetical protein
MTKLKDRKIVQLIRKTVEGKNKAGEVLHGALDVLPLPNQFVGKALKAVLNGNTEEVKSDLKEAFTLRNIVAILLTTALVMGWITAEEVATFGDGLNDVIETINN